MAIPKIKKKDVIAALEYIDTHGVPAQNQSTRYELIAEDGKRYPPKYVIAVAAHLANGIEIAADTFNAVEAKTFLQHEGFEIEEKQQKYELTITANQISSTDERFTMGDLGLGDHYKPLDTYFEKAGGTVIRRKYGRGERRNTNQTMPRIACQIFEKQLAALSIEEKETFPICQYKPSNPVIRGIYSSVNEYRKYRNTIEYLTYGYDNGRQFVLYCWNIFSTILFVQECLKRFGEPGDRFVLVYRDKNEREEKTENNLESVPNDSAQSCKEDPNSYSAMLRESKNIIFRGAPGTGKTYLAREIAANIVSDGYYDRYEDLLDEQKQQIGFVQFHPSYDYTDFVEGLRPKLNGDGSMGFELQDGIFKKFIARARKNYEDSSKSQEMIAKEVSAQDALEAFFASIQLGEDEFRTITGNTFFITGIDDRHISIRIPGNACVDTLSLNMDEIRKMLESDRIFDKIKDVTSFFGKQFATQAYSYDFALYKEIKSRKKKAAKAAVKREQRKNYVFIIDEINRGEISKIFGELFFAIDPGYRGETGAVSTQYANMHADPDEKFYIPENVYLIGTMNDIDRSVDSFDFAMRRRFRFIEIKANDRLEMLDQIGEKKEEAIRRMTALNQEIANTEELNENYQIGAAYFLKLQTLSFDQFWTDCLRPLLQEYVHGMYDESGIMQRFEKAYGYPETRDGDTDEATEN